VQSSSVTRAYLYRPARKSGNWSSSVNKKICTVSSCGGGKEVNEKPALKGDAAKELNAKGINESRV